MGTTMSNKIALFIVLLLSCVGTIFADCTDPAKCDPFTPPKNPFSDSQLTA